MMRLLWLDARQLMRERLALWVLIAGLVCSAAAVWSGHAWLERLHGDRAAFLQENAATNAEYRAALAAGEIDAAELALAPVRVTLPLAFPVPPLADFSIGRSDIEPTTAIVRMRYRSDTLFRNYQIDNPERLVRGRIDLAFVVIVLAPLLLIALGFGIFSADRDKGTAKLILAQAGTPSGLMITRSINRFLLVAAPIVLASAALVALGPASSERTGQAALWLAIALLSLAFWQALVLFVNAFHIRAETAALALVGFWAVFVFAAPAAINAGAQFAHPPPSRLALVVEARAAEIAATGAYQNDHPELAADPTLPQVEQFRRTVARNFGIGATIETRIAPLINRFDQQLTRQMRAVETAQLWSPPMSFAGLLASVAGTDAASYSTSRKAAFENLSVFKQRIGALIDERRTLALSDYDGLPRFESPPASALPILPLLAGLVLTFALFVFALLRLARARID
jgi:ABC-2 type transport system permease protein